MIASHLKATAFGAVCILLIVQANTYTMQDMCKQWSGTGYIGNPADCTGWGYCKGQKLVSFGNCAKNEVYNPQSAICQYNYEAPCTTSVSQSCSALRTATYLADPTDCSKYAYCFGNGTSKTESCPGGQRYSASNNACVWGPGCPQDTICRFMPNNIYVGDPNNCGQYLQCIKGSGVEGKCRAPRLYNAATGICQNANPCTDTGANTGNTDPSLPPQTVQCSKQGFVGDSKTCFGFYYCKTATGQGNWGACPPGTEFDDVSQKCVSPASLTCKFNRCANTNLTYAAVAGTGCRTYTYCRDGSTSNCDPSFPYYDEIKKICTTAQPDYPICKKTPPAS